MRIRKSIHKSGCTVQIGRWMTKTHSLKLVVGRAHGQTGGKGKCKWGQRDRGNGDDKTAKRCETEREKERERERERR